MKNYLKQKIGTDQIDKIEYEDLKQEIEGDSMVKRLKYRKNASGLTYSKPAIAKG